MLITEATPSAGAWTGDCTQVPPITTMQQDCAEAKGSASFVFSVKNSGPDPLAITNCTATPVTSTGESLPAVSVPMELTYGVPYTFALAEPGNNLQLTWFASRVAPKDVASYRATCDAKVNRGPYPL